jgi:hypothetical protein
MTDYRKMPLGPLGPGRIGEIVECPHCHDHALKVEDYKDSRSGSKEKELIYIHFEAVVLRQKVENGKIVVVHESMMNACGNKIKPTSLQTPSLEGTPRE